jgi:hypothetical protein
MVSFRSASTRKDGTYSVGAMQTSSGGPTYRLPSIYPLRRGRQVREAVEQIFLDDPLASEEVDWQKIISVLSKHVPELAREIEKSFSEDEIAEEEIDSQYDEQEKLKAPINDWVDNAKWPLSPLSRRKIVFDFVYKYWFEHGCLPIASHTLHQDFTVQFPDG